MIYGNISQPSHARSHHDPAPRNLIRCIVQRVDEETQRVVVTLNRATVPPSSALYLRSLLSEIFASAAAGEQTSTSEKGGEGGAGTVLGRLEFGATTNATVVALKEYGVVLKAIATTGKSKKAGADKGGQLMVCPVEHAMEGVEEGNEVKVRETVGVGFFGSPW